jgi:hypothetical protein
MKPDKPLNATGPEANGTSGNKTLEKTLSPAILAYPGEITTLDLATIRADLEEFQFIAEFYGALVNLCRLHLALRKVSKRQP